MTVRVSATVLERHGFQVLVRLVASPPPGAALDLPDVPYAMHAAGHRLAAELWGEAARLSARWAIDVSYAQVGIELVEGEPVHAAVMAAERACRAAGIELAPAARVRPPVKAKPQRRARKAAAR